MKRRLFIIGVLFLFILSVQGQTRKDKSEFRVVGYYLLQPAMTVDIKTVPFDKLTHINLAFLNPDTLGNFKQDLSPLIPFIKAAHANNVKVLPSIAGGGDHSYYHKLLTDDHRAKLINDLLLIALKYDFDGIDVDIEGSDIDENYERFVIGLANVLRPHGKLLTSAIAYAYRNALSDRALAQYDFVNIMSYDKTGPWNPSRPGPHSTYEHAEEDLDYFATVRGIPKDKMVLGVPFYGYGYGTTPTTPAISRNYRQILTDFPEAGQADQLDWPGDMTMYYNGVETMKKKTELAKGKASGIMIWQILGDAPGDKSLLKVINDVGYAKE